MTMTKSLRFRTTRCGEYLRAAVLANAALTVIGTAACRKSEDHKYTWADRLPQDDCVPRTPQVKAQLGGCPTLADPRHPTPDEAREFVDYMNRKQAIEGTVSLGEYQGPGCVEWRLNPATSQPEMQFTQQKQGCSNVEEQLRKRPTP